MGWGRHCCCCCATGCDWLKLTFFWGCVACLVLSLAEANSVTAIVSDFSGSKMSIFLVKFVDKSSFYAGFGVFCPYFSYCGCRISVPRPFLFILVFFRDFLIRGSGDSLQGKEQPVRQVFCIAPADLNCFICVDLN